MKRPTLYRLTEANYSNGDYYHYAYDAVGNRLSQTTELAVNSYQYDAANRLSSVDGVAYTWDNNGNLLNDGVNTYVYDSANRLTTLSNQQSASSYQYSGFGDRLKETANSNATTFTIDLNARYTRTLSDGINTYHYGIGIISQTHGSGTDYFLDDALGSVRQLADASGEITYAKAYDPFGVVRQATGDAETAYGFTGEYTSNDLVYLRARYYAPAIGRFFTQDPFSGYADLPQTQNPYSYAANNPIRYTDPTGRCIFAGVDTAMCIGAGLGAAGSLYIQLRNNGGNWACIDWTQVAISAGAGAVAGLVGIVAWGAIVPYTGATLLGYMGAGGLSGIVAGQAARATALALSGHSDQIISSFAQPEDVLSDFGFGTMGGAIGYGVESIAFGLRISVGVSDEFLPPSATGQWKNWTSTWEQHYYLSGGGNNQILDNVLAYNQSLAGRPSTLPIDDVFWAQIRVSPKFTDGTPLSQAVINYQSNPYPIRVFEKQPWMNQISPVTRQVPSGNIYTGNWSTMNNGEIYTLNNRSYTLATMAEVENIPVRWPYWDEIWEYSYQFNSPNFGREVWLAPDGPWWNGGIIR